MGRKNNKSETRDEDFAAAHMIASCASPENQTNVANKVQRIRNRRKTVRKTLKPHYSEAEIESAKALGYHQSQPSNILQLEA